MALPVLAGKEYKIIIPTKAFCVTKAQHLRSSDYHRESRKCTELNSVSGTLITFRREGECCAEGTEGNVDPREETSKRISEMVKLGRLGGSVGWVSDS